VEAGTVAIRTNDTLRDSATHAILLPYKLQLDSQMNQVLGTVVAAMPKETGKTETLLGNWVTDICLVKARQYYKSEDGQSPDICILNNGGLRTSIPQGPVTRGKIYELMPFDNELVVLTITGKKAKDLFAYIAATGGQPSSGFTMIIKGDKTPGAITVGGQPFDENKNYKVVTSDYLALGGDKMNFFNSPVKNEVVGKKIRDGLIEYCLEQTQKGLPLKSQLDKRITNEN
jgi:2',3'-cyclic-nucleotide 2'-phosphodiesterase (5'-nucleotidase family)